MSSQNRDLHSDAANRKTTPQKEKFSDQETNNPAESNLSLAQQAYLKTLSESSGEPVEEDLSREEASRKIEDLEDKVNDEL